jgi:hypothetical protein
MTFYRADSNAAVVSSGYNRRLAKTWAAVVTKLLVSPPTSTFTTGSSPPLQLTEEEGKKKEAKEKSNDQYSVFQERKVNSVPQCSPEESGELVCASLKLLVARLAENPKRLSSTAGGQPNLALEPSALLAVMKSVRADVGTFAQDLLSSMEEEKEKSAGWRQKRRRRRLKRRGRRRKMSDWTSW